MTSLRAVISAASLGSKSWSVLSSPILRNRKVFVPRKPQLTCEASFSGTAPCLSSDKDINSEHATSTGEDSQSTALKDKSIDPKLNKNQSESSLTDNFEEIIRASRRTFSPSFVRDCQYRLILWQKKVREAEKEGKQIDLEKILTDSFPDVVEFSLTPLALPEVRLSVLKILLSQQSDNRHLKRILQSTVEDAMQLPIGIVAEIVLLISLAPPTELRTETRRALVSAVVNGRWYEVGAKHLIFFMFQMDELYDIKTISKQWRQKSRAKEGESSTEKKKNVRKGMKTKTSATNTEKRIEETLGESFDAGGISKGEEAQSEATTEHRVEAKRDGEAAVDSLASVASVNMESRAITLANELKVKDLARVVSLLSRWKSRNEPLLNACLHRLSLADLSLFTLNQLSSLLQAMATLNLHHTALLASATQQLSSKLMGSAPSPSQVCAILQSLSLLRWTGVGEVGKDAVSSENPVQSSLSYLSSHEDKLTAKDAAGVLTSLAYLSVTPSSDAEKALVSDLAALVLRGKSPWWGQIHCVWCLSVLQSLDSAVLRKVLDPQFVEPVMQKVKESASPNSALVSANKLAQINTAARLDVEGYDGPVLSEEQLGVCTQMTLQTSEQRGAKAALANTLRKFVDLMTYVNLNPTIHHGVTADALMCANHEGEVRPLATREQSGSADAKTEPTLSLALQYIPFSGVNSPGETPTGQYQMAARHLGMLGYTPVQIFYSDLKPSLSILERVGNIKARIKTAVQVSNQSPTTNTVPPPFSISGAESSPSNQQSMSSTADTSTEQAPKPS